MLPGCTEPQTIKQNKKTLKQVSGLSFVPTVVSDNWLHG
jgi:hypothetical protein